MNGIVSKQIAWRAHVLILISVAICDRDCCTQLWDSTADRAV